MNTITPRNETGALLHEKKFQALLDDLDTAGDSAQYGHVLNDMDDYLFLHGRKFLTEILQSKTQERINAAAKPAVNTRFRLKESLDLITITAAAHAGSSRLPLLKVRMKQRRFNSKNLAASPSRTRLSAI